MDRFDAMRAFIRIVERRSFTKAADDLGLPRSSVTDAVKGLEARLGVRLLQRTTRQVSPTLDGEAYYQRCVSLIADLEDAEGAFVGAKPSGLVRVDMHGTQARYFLLPGLPRFREIYPDIRLHISEMHQPLDMIREGFDCLLRVGELSGSPLIRRRLATLERGTFASPDYLDRFGTPRTPDDLEGHEMVGLDVSGLRRDHTSRLQHRRKDPPADLTRQCDRDRARDQCRLSMPGPWTDPGAAIPRGFGTGQRHAGRSARRLSTLAIAGPRALFAHPPAVAAPARVHRLDGRTVPRTDFAGRMKQRAIATLCDSLRNFALPPKPRPLSPARLEPVSRWDRLHHFV